MKDPKLVLSLILESNDKIALFIKGLDFIAFQNDQKTQSAVIMQLIVVGELVKKLPPEITRNIDLPWRLMAGFRDLAVHQYFELDTAKIWETIVVDVPAVTKKLRAHLGMS